ncbi:MAG: response regulator, partial [Bacteroidia bacterium]|nr:response regulator [Bacteroidia bacterium]
MKTKLLTCFFFIVMSTSFAQDERDVISQIDSINTLALNYYNDNDIMQSINTFNHAIKLSDSIDDSYGRAVASFTLGKIYTYMKEYDDAERSYLKMLGSSQEIDDNFLIASAYLSLGEVYSQERNIEDVVPYFKKALEYAQKKDVIDINNRDKQQNVMFNIRMSLSKAYIDLNQPNEALIYLLRAEDNLDNSSFSNYNEALLSYMYGLYFVKKESYFKANTKFTEAEGFLADEDETLDLKRNILISDIYKSHSMSLAHLGNNDEAYAVLLKHNSSRETILNEEQVKQENIAKSKLFIEEYKRMAQLANKENLLQAEVTRKMQKINLVITFAIFLLLISLITLYKNYISKRKLSIILEARNAQLEIARDEAEKSSELKTTFISNVTHELRTPLYGVVGLTSLLLKSNDLSERDNKFLKSLKFSGDYLLNLINDILQVGKIESENVDLQIASVNIRTLIENIIDSFEYRIQENNNQIQISIDDNLPELIKCDNVRLSQVLINLIGNSIKFTTNGKIEIGVEVLNFVKEGVQLRFSVKDNGPGIPKDKHERIFDNFSQLTENNVDYNGTGLGLSIARKLVELFDSTIELESEVGVGSDFSFEVTFDVEKDVEVISNARKPNGKTVPLHEKHMILVAEDNKINQIVTQNVLHKGNFECELVENGLEALNAVKDNNSYDLILMDLNMPVMNGVDATKEIRKLNPHIPIIALTAADIEEVKNDFEGIGFNDVI